MDRIHLAFFTHESERAGKKGRISQLKAPESVHRAVLVTAHAAGGETAARDTSSGLMGRSKGVDSHTGQSGELPP